MKKLVLTEEQYSRLFEPKVIEEQQDTWSQMDDEEKREYLQSFTSDSDKIEQLLRSPQDPTKEFEGMSDDGSIGDISVERSTEEVLNDMEGDVRELQRSIELIKSRM
jgi:chaperonin cofactor prefoldin